MELSRKSILGIEIISRNTVNNPKGVGSKNSHFKDKNSTYFKRNMPSRQLKKTERL